MASTNEVKLKSLDEVNKELAAKQTELRDAKYSHSAGELVNPRKLKELRKEIARLKTAINSSNDKEVK